MRLFLSYLLPKGTKNIFQLSLEIQRQNYTNFFKYFVFFLIYTTINGQAIKVFCAYLSSANFTLTLSVAEIKKSKEIKAVIS